MSRVPSLREILPCPVGKNRLFPESFHPCARRGIASPIPEASFGLDARVLHQALPFVQFLDDELAELEEGLDDEDDVAVGEATTLAHGEVLVI